MTDSPKHPGGRPSEYEPAFAEQARKLCELGATEEDLADFFGKSIRTIANWKTAHPEFLQALKVGKDAADDRVERSLYRRAVGYSFDSEKVFQFQGAVIRAQTVEHVPPDTTAMIFWLKNRRAADWRDKHEVEHTHRRVSEMSDDELQRIAAGSGDGTPAKTNGSALTH